MYHFHRHGRSRPRVSSRYYRNRSHRFSHRYPWYTLDRFRDRPADRDRAFWIGLNGDDDAADSRYVTIRPTEEEEDHKPEILKVELETKLKVEKVNLHIKENAKAHHTSRYECLEDRDSVTTFADGKAELVIRRGQEFKMTIEFDRPYSIKKNDIVLMFNLGDDYKPNRNLNATFRVDESGKKDYIPKKWGASIVDQKKNLLTLDVFIPASVPIGEWEVSIRTVVDVVDGEEIKWQYLHNQEINVIFNPWCKEDWVYVEDERWREEAVLNDSGVQYTGDKRRLGARTWFYGQFEDSILDAAFHLVRKSFGYRAAPGMGNPVTVSRLISQMVNSQDDHGVLMGNWSGEYDGGTAPYIWTSSEAIIREYMKFCKPVKYGQCWVFSAVTTAVCRALGLPCRSVTNFASAHNTDLKSLNIDTWERQEKEGGAWIKIKDDSVWNFHVWNEVWMARPDLSDKQEWDGWQVIDATPQEASGGVHCCGPAPVKAIKEGEITVGKDGEFVFAEVNADIVHWKQHHGGKLIQIKRQRDRVGKNISTHVPTGRAYRGSTVGGPNSNNMERLDLTDAYKYEDGSDKEREMYKKASRRFKLMNGRNADDSDDEGTEEEMLEKLDIEIQDPGDVFVGSTFEFVVSVKNITQAPLVVRDMFLKVFYKTYFDSCTGMADMRRFSDFQLPPGEAEIFHLPMDQAAILARPADGYNFELCATANLADGDHVMNDLMFRLRRPDVKIVGPKKCCNKDPIEVEVSFTNPLDVNLTECHFNMAGGFRWIEPNRDRITLRDIGPGETWKEHMTIKLHATDQKERELAVEFDSKQLNDITGYYVVEVERH